MRIYCVDQIVIVTISNEIETVFPPGRFSPDLFQSTEQADYPINTR